MKEKIKEKLMKWWSELILVDPCPMPFYNIWDVNVDGKTIKIVASNRVFAYLKAKVKYPKAKYIQVVKRLKPNYYL